MFGYGTFAHLTFAEGPEVEEAASNTLAVTEGADAAALAGEVLVQGDLSATEGADTAALAGKVKVQGDLAITEGADAAAFSGDVVVQGDLASTEGADVAALSGIVLVQGDLAVTEGADAAAISGDVLVQGDLAATEGADTAAFNGSVIVQGDLSVTEGADAASFTTDVVVGGSFALTEGADAASFDGSIVVQGDLAATEGADSAHFVGAGAIEQSGGLVGSWAPVAHEIERFRKELEKLERAGKKARKDREEVSQSALADAVAAYREVAGIAPDVIAAVQDVLPAEAIKPVEQGATIAVPSIDFGALSGDIKSIRLLIAEIERIQNEEIEEEEAMTLLLLAA